MSQTLIPLFVTRKLSTFMSLFNVIICAIKVPWAGPRPGNNPIIQPEILPAKTDFLNLESITIFFISF